MLMLGTEHTVTVIWEREEWEQKVEEEEWEWKVEEEEWEQKVEQEEGEGRKAQVKAPLEAETGKACGSRS